MVNSEICTLQEWVVEQEQCDNKKFSIESQSKEKPVGRINACNVLLDIAQSPQVSTNAVKTVVVDLFSFNPRNSCAE